MAARVSPSRDYPTQAVVFPREVRARVNADPRIVEARAKLGPRSSATQRGQFEKLQQEVLLEKQADVAREFDGIHTVQRALEVGSLEGIIEAKKIRPHLIECVQRDARVGRLRASND